MSDSEDSCSEISTEDEGDFEHVKEDPLLYEDAPLTLQSCIHLLELYFQQHGFSC